jgi:hypothetical protein
LIGSMLPTSSFSSRPAARKCEPRRRCACAAQRAQAKRAGGAPLARPACAAARHGARSAAGRRVARGAGRAACAAPARLVIAVRVAPSLALRRLGCAWCAQGSCDAAAKRSSSRQRKGRRLGTVRVEERAWQVRQRGAPARLQQVN